MNIRLEEEKDYYDNEFLTREAFFNIYRPGCFEHLVLHNLRKDSCFVKDLDYVLTVNNKIIANIVYSLATIENDKGIHNVLIFGPVSVHPDYQKQGYGKAIIDFSLNKAKELGYPCVLITGDPDYYKKYGFESASKYNIYYKGADKTDDATYFMIKILDKDLFDLYGEYSDPVIFNIDEKELEEFDKNFPYKKKEKRDGQLV